MKDSYYSGMYRNKIAVHPDAVYGSGYFHEGNWSLIEFQPSKSKWLDTNYPIDEHYVSFGFEDGKYRKTHITIDKLTGAEIIDVPESFDTIEDYLAWLEKSGIKVTANDRKWILHAKSNIAHKVMRNYNGAHVFPGGFYIVGMAEWEAKMLDGGTHEHAVRCYTGKRAYQTFCGSSFQPKHHELYQVLSTFPDLTTQEMHEAGIEDFG